MITAKDHAAIQISVADVDADGVAQSTSTSFAISGQVRAMGESDDSLNRLATKAGCESLYFWCYCFEVLMAVVGFFGFPGGFSFRVPNPVLRNVWSFQK